VPRRGPLARSLLVVGVAAGGALVLAGALALRGAGLTAVAVAGLFAACLCAAIARESWGGNLRSTLGAAAQGAGWTVAVLLALAGTAGLAGGVIAALAAGIAVMGGAAYWLVRAARARHAGAAARPGAPRAVVADPAVRPAQLLRPVLAMSTRALGDEWVRTSAVLAGRLDPAARAALVLRRHEALDELERRDPEGFSRWLLGGPVPGSDPADYVRHDRIAGTDAA
jgi:hypothetical protein